MTETIAIIRIRGNVNVTKKIEDTMQILKLKAVNNCITVQLNETTKGMIQKIKDYVTFGTINEETFKKMMLKWGKTTQGQKVTEQYLKEQKTTMKEIYEGTKKFKDTGIKQPFRLHPPRKGYEGIKKPFTMGGALGNRKEKINKLLERMI